MNLPDCCPARRGSLGAAGALALAFALTLTGCATPPPPAPPAHFSPAQVTALRQMGFAEVTEGWELNLAGKVLFSFNDEHLDAAGSRTVHGIAETLLKEGLTSLRIEGHADNVGDADYNRRLSTRRAEVVTREFIAHGMPAARIEARGQGMGLPIADNTTEAGRAQNRRVVILVRGD
ncbi:OmpA family protein [Sphaerotilus sp.]|uniref:OmpA family protein n=1 Tax=Sphaerotilus sp. TaxID=2093942 RepID=UPI0034E20455